MQCLIAVVNQSYSFFHWYSQVPLPSKSSYQDICGPQYSIVVNLPLATQLRARCMPRDILERLPKVPLMLSVYIPNIVLNRSMSVISSKCIHHFFMCWILTRTLSFKRPHQFNVTVRNFLEKLSCNYVL